MLMVLLLWHGVGVLEQKDAPKPKPPVQQDVRDAAIQRLAGAVQQSLERLQSNRWDYHF